jgi:glycosyltransferase involved in cell wall biosynthesis
VHGTPLGLQALRVQAASLRIAARVDVQPMPTFDDAPPSDVLATWVAMTGDAGVTSALWAMRAGQPVVVSAEHDAATLLEDRRSGVVVPGGSPYDEALVASELARLLGHHEDRVRMGEAASERARQYDPARLARALRVAIDRAMHAVRR